MNREKLEKIESYANDSLTLEEKKSFQREIEENPELLENVNRFVFTKDIIKSASIRKEVSEVHRKFMLEDYQSQQEDEVKKPVIKKLFWSNTVRIAASIVLVIGVWAAYQATTLNPESIIADSQIEYTSSTFRGEKSNLGNVRGLYRNGNYAKMLQILEKEANPNAEMVFLKAMANFKMKNYQMAINEFEQLRIANAKSTEPSFVHELAYYEALSLIGNQDYELAIQNLEKIKEDPNNPYRVGITEWQLFKLKFMK
jgi:tetratricopeptide (TPR) repeat protein